jgi:amino acid transporter
MVVAISWSGYFVGMLKGFGISFPTYLSIDSSTCKAAFKVFTDHNAPPLEIESARELATAYMNAPRIFDIPIIFNLPAGLITVLITALVYVGIKESRTASNILVALKLLVILVVIFGGMFFIKPENWSPFAPNGVQGVLGSVASVFFAFIGFDSISTTAEECKNPQRDLPKAMLYCLAICTVLYIGITLVLTGMVNYKEFKDVSEPLAFVFRKVGWDFMAWIISISAVVAITSALLVYQLGQPRIWMTMSRDGLLPKRFSKIHPRYKTPSFATFMTGLIVGVPSLFFNMNFFVDLTSVGTFFAFILVCGGILYMDYKGLSEAAKFRVPYVNGKYIAVIGLGIAFYYSITNGNFMESLSAKPLLVVFWLTWATLAFLAFKHNLSLLPILGILTNLYLMTELGVNNWTIFVIWLIIGLVIYFGYSMKHSKLNILN